MENIIQIDFADEMKNAYRDYAMSVIISRALPDVRDGLKPVQRRTLHTHAQRILKIAITDVLFMLKLLNTSKLQVS